MKMILTLILSLQLIPAFAETSKLFTPAEIEEHKANVETIVEVAKDCLHETYADHLGFYEKWHISKYYGNRRADYSTEIGLKTALNKYGAPLSLLEELTPISCVGLAMKCLKRGFETVNTGETWQKIYNSMAENGFDGTVLQKRLQELGWKVIYWNPNPASNAQWDAEDQKLNPLAPGKNWNPAWGGHAYNYSTVVKKQIYYGVKVDDAQTLVSFKTTIPESFKQYDFFVGTAHAGYHVFPGTQGKIIEAHSMRNLNDITNLETSPFNPLATGGGPRWSPSVKYRSGIIAVPPTHP